MTTTQESATPTETQPVSVGEFLAWDSDRLVVTDPEQLRKVNRPRLSASTAKAIESCPARYVSDKTFPGVDNPFAATDLGTAAHAVLERLYTLPATGRSRLAAARATLELAEEVDFAAHFGDPSSAAVAKAQWIATVTEYYSGIWEIEDPTTVMVRRNEWPVNQVEVAGSVPRPRAAGQPAGGPARRDRHRHRQAQRPVVVRPCHTHPLGKVPVADLVTRLLDGA